jgi:hypothetical protein
LLPYASIARTKPSLHSNEELHVRCTEVLTVKRRQLARVAQRALH